MQDQEATILEISKKTGKTPKEINALIKAKIKKFEGLLTEQGATFMIGKELGLKQDNVSIVKINELEDGMKDIEVQGIIKTIYPVKEFEKNGKVGKLGSLLLEDDSAITRVTLWNDQIDKYELTPGSEIKIVNGFVTSYNEKKQLSLGYNGTIEILNKQKEIFEKINDLKSGMNNANVIGRLLRKFPCKEFETGEKKGKLCNFQFGDETALLRATAWNQKADEIQNYNEGDIIEIKNAYTKAGMYGIELHMGYSSIINKSQNKMPTSAEILKESTVQKNINQLVKGENVIIAGKIKEIQQGKLFFMACTKCGKKVNGEGMFICDSCGEVNAQKRAIINCIIEDDSGEIRANCFGENALTLIEMNNEDFEIQTDEKSAERIIEELNEKINGKEIKFFGYEKENTFSGTNEFTVKEIIK
jgi:replication factor A1